MLIFILFNTIINQPYIATHFIYTDLVNASKPLGTNNFSSVVVLFAGPVEQCLDGRRPIL